MGIEQERFVQVDPELICCICANVFEDPTESPCQHVFCRECISRWLEDRNTCPTCRSPLHPGDLRPPLPLLKNILAKLRIRCNYLEQGCTTIVDYEQLGNHIRRCPYGPNGMSCQNEGCQDTFPRNEKERHEAECPYRKVVCTQLSNHGCGMEYKLNEAANHNCVDSLKALVRDLQGKVSTLEQTVNELKHGMQAIQNAQQTNSHSLETSASSCTCESHSNPELISLISDDEEDNEQSREATPVYRIIGQPTPTWICLEGNSEGNSVLGSSPATNYVSQLDRQRRQSRSLQPSTSTPRRRSRSRSPIAASSLYGRRERSPSDIGFNRCRSRMGALCTCTQTSSSVVSGRNTTTGQNLTTVTRRNSRQQSFDNDGQVITEAHNSNSNSDHSGPRYSAVTSSEGSNGTLTSPQYSASGYSSSDVSYLYLGEAEYWWPDADDHQVMINIYANDVSYSSDSSPVTTTSVSSLNSNNSC